jgi:hypothetical protein
MRRRYSLPSLLMPSSLVLPPVELSAGVLDFHGPVSLSNLTISPNKVSGLSPVAICDAECKDPRFLRNWKVSPPQREPTETDKALDLETGVPPHYSDLPSPAAAWCSMW